MLVVRYADDLVAGFEHRAEAERFLKEFQERLAKFGLELHAEKTRLIEFGRFARDSRQARGAGEPESLTFVGFTHYCGTNRAAGEQQCFLFSSRTLCQGRRTFRPPHRFVLSRNYEHRLPKTRKRGLSRSPPVPRPPGKRRPLGQPARPILR